MTQTNLNEHYKTVDCIYDGERYSVRDNGEVLRYPRVSDRPRPTDEKWTFGKPNTKTGYMEIASVRVHRIVATAFHGDPPTPVHVVDHIDTNRKNNRPENLRWLTRLEHILLNPITVKRIEFICGSIEAFLEDPSKLRHGSLDRGHEWMRAVSPEEAQACLQRMLAWSKEKKPSSGGSLGEWLFTRNPVVAGPAQVPYESLVMAKTPGAAQRNWRIASEFLNCPQESVADPIATYASKLKAGAIFSRNHFSESITVKTAISKDCQSLWVVCSQNKEGAVKPWAFAQVTYEGGLYVHTSHGTFFSNEGVEKQFCLAQGLEWTGGDSIDEYC